MKLKLYRLASLLIGAVSVAASTAADVLNDINAVCSLATSFNSAVVAFPTSGGTLAAALTIHNRATSLNSALNTAILDTTNVIPTPMSPADSAAICTALSTCALTFQSLFNRLVVLKPSWSALPLASFPALIRTDVRGIIQATSDLETVLAAHLDPGSLSCLSGFQTTVDPAKAACLAAYP